MEQISQYIKADYAILVAVLYCLGRAFRAIRKFPNQFIPLALTGCGVVLACLSVVSRYGEYANWAAALFDPERQKRLKNTKSQALCLAFYINFPNHPVLYLAGLRF